MSLLYKPGNEMETCHRRMHNSLASMTERFKAIFTHITHIWTHKQQARIDIAVMLPHANKQHSYSKPEWILQYVRLLNRQEH